MTDYDKDRNFSDNLMPQVQRILRHNADLLIDIKESTVEEDEKEATDLKIFEGTSGRIAVRTRRSTYDFRDLTLRVSRPSGAVTELKKIRDGFCDYYFYGWLGKCGLVKYWMLVDLNIFRESGLAYENQDATKNDDGTEFYTYTLDELAKAKCLVSFNEVKGVE